MALGVVKPRWHRPVAGLVGALAVAVAPTRVTLADPLAVAPAGVALATALALAVAALAMAPAAP